MPFDASKLKNVGADTLDAVVQGFQAHAETAMAEAKSVLLYAAKLSAELASDFAGGRLTFEQMGDFLRKVGVAVETELAKIALETARKYVKTVLDSLLGGALKIIGAF